MSSREKILDAYEAILIEDGERAASMNAIAARATVSKGGLLYHFPDKSALVDALLERAWALAERDFEAMAADPAGACEYYVRTSVFEATPFDRVYIACSRLRQDAAERVSALYDRIQGRWLELIRAEVPSDAAALAVLLIGDGLYYNAALASSQGHLPLPVRGETEGLLEIVRGLRGSLPK